MCEDGLHWVSWDAVWGMARAQFADGIGQNGGHESGFERNCCVSMSPVLASCWIGKGDMNSDVGGVRESGGMQRGTQTPMCGRPGQVAWDLATRLDGGSHIRTGTLCACFSRHIR
jgi:hypothetical protein